MNLDSDFAFALGAAAEKLRDYDHLQTRLAEAEDDIRVLRLALLQRVWNQPAPGSRKKKTRR